MFLGILGNTLLCLGVWLTYSGRSTTDRIIALVPPVTVGNVIGGGALVALAYWFVYLRPFQSGQ